MFQVGDAVVHPVRGTGVVVGFEELQQQENSRLYYVIELLGLPESSLLIPVKSAEKKNLRPVIPEAQLDQVWKVLDDQPAVLPSEHKTRYKLLEDKFQSGDTLLIAEAVRDMTWRQQHDKGLTGRGQRIFQRGMRLLAAEVAATQGIELQDAEDQIRHRLEESLPEPVEE
jgi:RNA polymerase-interacting CarD/CdnL/TRCF family regulator